VAGHTLAAALRAGRTVYTAWVLMPEPLVAETVARAGFDAVTIDMQHGLHGPETVMRLCGAVAHAGKAPIVRVPVGDWAMTSRALDKGAEAVIAPMIESIADARAFAAAAKYPPMGNRSWGPFRAMTLAGNSDLHGFVQEANHNTLALAMVESQAAIDIVDDILAVEGIDGIFVGPLDLSLSLSGGTRLSASDPEVLAALDVVVARCNAAGKIAAVFAASAERARGFAAQGFRLIALNQDFAYLATGAARILAEAKGEGADDHALSLMPR
jgi:4-hydroxy-2-oxoheptanedioate aldolase